MKPSIPKGTRDFGPVEVRKRNYIFDTIRQVFIQFGFEPIETPVLENLSTLTGKYGDEGDQLLFKILNNGDFLSKANEEALAAKDSKKLLSSISKRGLRYDLTVPFARFVVMHQNDLNFPFRRYQIQPVWRGDRPAKGRYQEFYQCDADIVGSTSLMNEVELVQIYDQVFKELKIPVEIKVNNRKILAGLAEVAGISDKFNDMAVAIDKLDKIGIDGVKNELANRSISSNAIETILKVLETKELGRVSEILKDSEIGQKGIEELRFFHKYLDLQGTENEVKFDCTLARGLSYYTGCIFEVKAIGIQMGSIGGGGRYDDLTGVFGLKNVSGVGVSFGADRIYDVMLEMDIFPDHVNDSSDLLLVALDSESHLHCFSALNKLRKSGIKAILYPEPAKLKKQMKYANGIKVPYVALVGSQEMETNVFNLKNMTSGEEQKVSLEELINITKV